MSRATCTASLMTLLAAQSQYCASSFLHCIDSVDLSRHDLFTSRLACCMCHVRVQQKDICTNRPLSPTKLTLYLFHGAACPHSTVR
jgi:hypothetical protein